MGESYQDITIDSEEDPVNYKEALEDVDAQEWLKAMDREMEFMYFNSVWSLVEAPKGVKPKGCKWIYKRKRRPDGKVETFKARLVAKCYTQKKGIDYEETFSPVAMLKSIWMSIASAATQTVSRVQCSPRVLLLLRFCSSLVFKILQKNNPIP